MANDLEFTTQIEPYFRYVFSHVIDIQSPELLEMHLRWLESDSVEQRKLALEFFERHYVAASKSVTIGKQLIDPRLIEQTVKEEAHVCWDQFLHWALIRAQYLDTELGRRQLHDMRHSMANSELAWLVGPDDGHFRIPMTPSEHYSFYGVYQRFGKLIAKESQLIGQNSGIQFSRSSGLIGQPTPSHGVSPNIG